MSKLNYKGQLTGAIGPVYFRMLNGRMVMQTKPGKARVRQHINTKQSASEFGRVSKAGKNIRIGLQEILQGWHDSTMFSRFTGQLYQAVKTDHTSKAGERHLAAGDLSVLSGFEFNSASHFCNWSNMKPAVVYNSDHTLDISLNPVDGEAGMRRHPSAAGQELIVFVKAFDPVTLIARAEKFVYRYDTASDETSIPFWRTPAISQGSFIMVVAALHYYRHDSIWGKKYLNGKDFYPCALAGCAMV